ncbi:MAG TPA: hypothetical protein PKW18_13410 [Candidatus Sumerlaeota bacterium]|nr:MAG: hypothetical protein BWY12_02586 [candidate division BRC1 bacterium ADurb.Bin183]HOE64441.1 hypothetical protein [Candidatus Sumerlaeota bacterium]HRR30596.1 hypothetical protein [Candidatus Sumerlaeia bacterium]HON50000.1 hypothetical protein [Candidatus Sumerlaeota bacterium]HOR65867.1 hypothetical protein [Candidatus Sumerlaeota bacterium]
MNAAEKKLISKTLFGFIILLFILSPILTLRLSPNVYSGGTSKGAEYRQRINKSSIAIILGEARANLSDMMFIKTERYMHAGVAYKLNIDYDAMSSAEHTINEHDDHPTTAPRAHDSHAHQHEHDDEGGHIHDEGAETIIPTSEKDFRGFIGELQRRVKPWLDPSQPHYHLDGTEMLPWFRLMTISDPHHIRGYMIGAWWLKKQRKKPQLLAAKNFLEEGIHNNPDSFQLYLMLGTIRRSLEDYDGAKESYYQAAERAIKQRPANGELSREWTHYQEDDALASVRLAVFSEKEFGDAGKALKLAEHYLSLIGSDPILEDYIRALKRSAENNL